VNSFEVDAVYHCDNLTLMRGMPSTVFDLIYCDVLYGTGKK